MDPRTPDWLRSIAVTGDGAWPRASHPVLSAGGADYLERIAADGTLEETLNEIDAA